MKKLLWVLFALCLLMPAACGGHQNAQGEAAGRRAPVITAEGGQPAGAGVPDVPPPGPEPEAPAASAQEAARAAYRAVLEDIYTEHKFPDGVDHGYEEPLSADANQFALFDVDQDGREELIVTYTSPPLYAGRIAFVLDYDEAAGAVRMEFSNFPLLTFYDNGVIQAGWSHNQGRAGDSLWPYTFWRYDAETDAYTAGEDVDAWDKSLVEEGFPDSVDADGDGVVYYIMPYGSYDTSQPVDGPAYQQWRDAFVGGAQALQLPYAALNAENIERVK